MIMSPLCARWGDGVAAGAPDARADGGTPVGGGATAPRRRAVPGGDRPRVGGQPCGGDAVEAAPGPPRAGRAPPAPVVRASVAVERGPVGPAARAARARRRGRRVRDRALDAAADRWGDR